MATTTKREIAERVAQQTGVAQVSVKQIVQMTFDEIITELAIGNRLEFRDFGVFEVVTRKARTGRNPRTGAKVAVPPKSVVTFKMGKVMREKVGTAEAKREAAQQTGAGEAAPKPPAL
jgi:integration host factor subunit beta